MALVYENSEWHDCNANTEHFFDPAALLRLAAASERDEEDEQDEEACEYSAPFTDSEIGNDR